MHKNEALRVDADPLDWPLPCDLTAGGITIKKGCPLRTVQTRLQVQSEANSALLRAAAPAAPTTGAPNSAEELARDLKKAIETATELREQLRLMEEHARNEVWRWQADGADDLATMGNRMGILIYASDLRTLLAQLASPATYVNSAGIVASDMPGTVVRKLSAAFHKVTGTPNTDAIDQAEKGGA